MLPGKHFSILYDADTPFWRARKPNVFEAKVLENMARIQILVEQLKKQSGGEHYLGLSVAVVTKANSSQGFRLHTHHDSSILI